MLLSIRHHLRYVYGRPVFLEPMTLRLTPKQDCSQQLLEHSLRLEAAPAGSSAIQAADGSGALVCWFSEERDQLEITMEARVRTLRPNPFDWIITFAPAQRLPARYPEAERAALAAYLDPSQGASTGASLQSQQQAPFQAPSQAQVQAPLGFRPGAGAGPGAGTVAAWAEVYLPGACWRGYDPSLGLAVADGHLVLATAPDHRLAAPVTGTYRGTGVSSTMTYALTVKALDGETGAEGWSSNPQG